MANEQDHDFRDRIRASFDRQGAMALIGAELTHAYAAESGSRQVGSVNNSSPHKASI